MHRKPQLISPLLAACLTASLTLHAVLFCRKSWKPVCRPAQVELKPGRTAVELTLLPHAAPAAQPPPVAPPIQQPEPEPPPIQQPEPEPPPEPQPEPLPAPAIQPSSEPAPQETPAAPVAAPSAAATAPEENRTAEQANGTAAGASSAETAQGVETLARSEIACSRVYPRPSRIRGEEGTVVIALTVTADGRAENIVVKQSSGHSRLDQSALKAVQSARFKPALRNGRAITSRLEQKFVFKLRGSK